LLTLRKRLCAFLCIKKLSNRKIAIALEVYYRNIFKEGGNNKFVRKIHPIGDAHAINFIGVAGIRKFKNEI